LPEEAGAGGERRNSGGRDGELMADDGRAPMIHIDRRHQSAPKEHWADTEIKKAAAEIDSGRYMEDPNADREEREAMEGLGLALGAGTERGVATGEKPALAEFAFTEQMNQLGRHPRVKEAMERMALEIETAPSMEAAEKTCMLREMAEENSRRQKWAEQGKLAGTEDEESRYGLILSPQQFYDRLGKVVGKGRLKLSPHVVKTNAEAKSGRVGLYVRNPNWDGKAETFRAGERGDALKMADEAQQQWNEARSLQRLGRSGEAEKKVKEVAAMTAEAQARFRQAAADSYSAEPEFVRVGTLQWPCGTEWMVCNFNEFGVVTTAKYLGWRTALLQMIRARVITENQAHKAFPVGSGSAGDWYLEQLLAWRNTTGSVN
jgi:hypothetical protein